MYAESFPLHSYYFLATGSSVKIHSRLTGEVVSTLSARDPGSQGTTQSKRLDVVHTAKITGIALHPLNQLQLITASLDGTVKVWDFLDGALLASYDVGFPVSHLAVHEGLGSIFVAITKPKSSEPGKTDPFNYSGELPMNHTLPLCAWLTQLLLTQVAPTPSSTCSTCRSSALPTRPS